MSKSDVIEVEGQVVKEVQPEVAPEPSVRTEVVVGIDTNGSIYHLIQGPDQSLITVSGLVDYLNIVLKGLWDKALLSHEQK
jgi:hypothetical protein